MICAFTNNSSCLQGLLFVFRGGSLCRICKLVQQTRKRTFPRATLAGQPLRHSVPPPLAQGRLGDVAACHLPLHRGGWEMLQCATSAYIREGSRFCKIIPLEDTPHGSLVPREQSAGTADGGIDGLVQHIKRTTQRLLGGSFLFSCKNQRTMLIKPAWPWLKTCHWQVFGALRRCAACISFTIASIGATNPLSRFYQSSLLRHYNW